jgi:O-acetyl-ADP-ribose deacetylase (regulator of RNase III)
MKPRIVRGDLLDQEVDVIVNSWNRNILPWWLLWPQGTVRDIKRRAGMAPLKALTRSGRIALGGARETSAGSLPFKAIIHVAGVNLLLNASQYSVTRAVINAMAIVDKKGYESVAFPLIGAGPDKRDDAWSLRVMERAFLQIESPAKVTIVLHGKLGERPRI